MNVSKSNKWQSLLLGTALVSSGFLCSQSVLAQENSAEEGDGPLEEIITTGSRIKRADNVDSPVPMVTLGEDQIELTGSVNVYDILNELPQAGEGFTRGNTNFTVGSSGIQTINLRGLGSSRTLTLVNGRRWVGGVPGTGIVDLNSIPADLIERLEVVTGGASSVYGSDAVAGVVNIILKDDYEGVDLEVMGGQYMEGDGETYSVSATLGGNFDGGRGNAIFNARMDSQGRLMARDRAPYTGRDVFYYGWYYGNDFGAPYDSLIDDPAYSSYPAQGRFFVSGSTGNSQNMMTFDCSQRDEDSPLPSDTPVFWSEAGGTANCGFNRTYHRALEVPLDRYSAFSKVTYDLNDEHQLFAEMSYTSVESKSEFEPYPLNSEDIFGGLGNRGYHYTNPFVPQEIADEAVDYHMILSDPDDPNSEMILDPSWNGQIPFIRRMVETNNRGSLNTRDTFRVAIGTEGSLGNFDYDWYYQYGENKRLQTSSGQFNAMNFQQALDVVVLNEGTPAEQVVCANEVAQSQGCVPINVFGIGAITPEAAAWVGYDPMRRSVNTQQVFGGNITGSFTVLNRDIAFATGFEWREEYSDDDPDDLQEQGLHGGNVVPRTIGEYDVTGAYVEVLVPLLYDLPLIQDLTLEAAYRSDDYSSAGRVDASKVGLNWRFTDSISLRAVYAESVRAPDINDLFQGAAQTYTSISDPCAGLGTDVEGDMNPRVRTNCYSIPDVANTAENGSYDPDAGGIVPGFIYSQPDIQTISGFVGGNENLSEESAETTTVGLVFTPTFAEGLAITLDYYEILIEDVIGSVSATRLINECYESDWSGGRPSQCSAHERFPETGKLRYWYSFGVNQSSYESKGFDLAAGYTLDDVIPGSLRFSLLYTQRDTHEFRTTVDSDPYDYVGEVGYNEDKYKFTIVYEIGDFLISLDNTIYGSAQDDISVPADAYHLNDVSTISYTDLQVRYFPTDSMQLYVGVDNLFDEQPPYCPNCQYEPSPGSGYTGGQHRPWDSMFGYAGIKYSFGKD
jgi:outer membrane receptor protein involved in Fe transport